MWREVGSVICHFQSVVIYQYVRFMCFTVQQCIYKASSSSSPKSKVEVTLRLTVIQSAFLGIEHPCGTCDQILFPVGMLMSGFAILFLWGALSDEKTGLQFAAQSLNGPSRLEPITILYCLIWDSFNLEGQVPVFISPRNRVAQLYSRAMASLYVVSYGSSLRLAGLRRKYSNPPATWKARSSYIHLSGAWWSRPKSKSKVKVTLRPTAS
jgi:hypothetical protein